MTKRKDIKVNIEGNKVQIGGSTWGPWPLFTRSAGETLYHVKSVRVPTNVAYVSRLGKTIDINLFHQRLGHPSKHYVLRTAGVYGVTLKGKMGVREACTYGKSSQKPVKKLVESRTNVPMERIFVDTSVLSLSPYRLEAERKV